MTIKEIRKTINIEWVKSEMQKHNISQSDLSKKLEIDKGQVSKWLNPNSDRSLKNKFHKIGIYYAIEELKL